MPLAVIVFLVVVLAVGASTLLVGRLARGASRASAGRSRPSAGFIDLDEVARWVVGQLSKDVSTGLSVEDVRRIVGWNMEYMNTKRVSGNGHSTKGEANVIVAGAEGVDYSMARALESGETFTALQLHAVLDAQMRYLELIGAVGPELGEDRT